jgi:amidase
MARSAADLGPMLDIIAGPDTIDADAWVPNLPKPKAKSLKDLRVAVMLSSPTAQVDAPYGAVLQTFVDQVARAGGKVSDRARPEIDMAELHDLFFMLLRAALSTGVAQPDVDRWNAIRAARPDANPRFLRSATDGVTMEHREWLKRDNRRHEMRAAFAAFFQNWDILLCPNAASTAFPHNQTGERWSQTIPVNNGEQYVTEQMFWAGLGGMVYLPSTVGPAGRTPSGLPGGYQAIAGHGRDHTAIAFARFAEREIGGFVPPPGY